MTGTMGIDVDDAWQAIEACFAQNWEAGARGLGARVGHEFTPHLGRELHYTFQNGGAKLGGWLHDFVPLLGISHERWRQ